MQALFSWMDNTNVKPGSCSGLKRYILHKILMSLWIGCGNHKLGLCFKNLQNKLPCFPEFDTTLLLLWKYFHYGPQQSTSRRNTGPSKNQAIPVFSSTIRWISHGKSCKTLYEDYQAQIGAPTVCYNERKELKAQGIFMAITLEIFIASLLRLCDVFEAIAPLNLVLQTGNKQLGLTDVN